MPTYDIHFELDTLEAQQSGNGKVYTFKYSRAVGVKGLQKLVNRWVKCFLTTKGTDPLSPNYGTEFPSLIGSNVSRRQDFIDVAALAVNDCNAQMIAYDNYNLPPLDERLQTATLTNVVERGSDGYDVYISIKSSANSATSIMVPATAASAQ